MITGSAGLGVAKVGGIDFVQEVYATAAAVTQYYPDTDAVIELGGEDAKIIFFGGALEERMNGSCAGGTGAFIDQMATLMNVSVNELDALSLNHEKIYPIASRCGVFAKSDIQPILNQGGRKEDVAASIFQAVVDQTVAGLTQGRELKGKIVFLGGPLHFLMGLRGALWRPSIWTASTPVFPEDGDCFAGIGAALCAADYADHPFDDLLRKLEESVDAANTVDTMPPLFTDEADYAAFLARHDANHPPEADIHTYAGDAYLGIDAGSTTTKVAPHRARRRPSLYLLPLQPGESGGYRARAIEGDLPALRRARHHRAAPSPGTARELIKKRLLLRSGAWWRRWPTSMPPPTSTPTWTSSSTSAARI